MLCYGVKTQTFMDKKIKELKEQFRKAKSEKELETIDNQVNKLIEKDEDAFAEALLRDMKSTAKEAENLILREKIKNILPIISVSYIAKKYFNKTPMWFYQRLNGNMVHGKQAKFTDEELSTLREAMLEVSKEIQMAAFAF